MPALKPALFDAHHIGLGRTGNERWARGVLGALLADGGAPLDVALTEPGRAELAQVPAQSVVPVSARSVVRLLRDLPLAVRSRRPSALVVQYVLPPVRVPGVVVVHDLSFEEPAARAWIPAATLLRYRLTIRASARQAAVVLAPTEFTRQQVVERYGVDPERVLVAPNAVDPTLAALVAGAREGPSDGAFRLLAVGTALPRKNLLVAARAARSLRDGGVDAVLRVVGPASPAALTPLRAVLPDGLEVVGAVSDDRLAAEYRAADVLVFPSLYEGFGVPVIEAMAAGTPVVASRATCLPEVVGPAGLLVDPHDEEAWASTLGDLCSDPGRWRELSAAGRKWALNFDWATSARAVRRACELASDAA